MDLLLFISLNTLNISAALMFISRVNFPLQENVFGITAMITAIPITVVGIFNKLSGNHFLSWLPSFIFTAWAVLSLFLDYILKTEFRNPPNFPVLIVFLILFYVPIAGLGIYIFKINKPFWYVTVITTALHLGATVYAHINGKG